MIYLHNSMIPGLSVLHQIPLLLPTGWLPVLGLVPNRLHVVFLSSPSFSSSFSSVASDSLWPHEPQHARPPCPSPTPGVHPNPCPLCRWWHPTISSSVVTFSSCPQPFPASGSFQMSQLSTSGGQSIGVSASASVPPHPLKYIHRVIQIFSKKKVRNKRPPSFVPKPVPIILIGCAKIP